MPDFEKARGRKKFDMIEWWEERTIPQKIFWGIGFGVMGMGLFALFGLVVMLLWNWLMPEIFGLKRVDYWQAWGLLVLSSILFKGARFGSDESSRRTDRRRRNELRGYLREGEPRTGDVPGKEPPAGETPADSPEGSR